MSSPKSDFDALLVDWLYGELDPAEAESFEQHLEAHPEARAEAAALRRTRAAFQDLDEAEPPSAMTAMLMHEAGLRADAKPGLWAKFAALFQPIMMHPAASAMATLVLVAGVAGALYLRNGDMVSKTRVASQADAPADRASLEAARDPAPSAIGGSALGGKDSEPLARDESRELDDAEERSADGFAVDLAGAENERSITRSLEKVPGSDNRQRAGLKRDKKSLRSEGSKRKRNAPLRQAAPVANAISGAGEYPKQTAADALADSDGDSPYAVPPPGEAAAQPGTRRARSKSKPRAAKSGGKNERKNADKESQGSSWEARQATELKQAARSKRCREAGRIANDILDKKPAFYKARVAKSKAVSDCRYYVASETKRRAKRRAKRAARRRAKGKGTSVPSKAKAAPQQDEAATDEVESAL